MVDDHRDFVAHTLLGAGVLQPDGTVASRLRLARNHIKTLLTREFAP